MNGKSLFLFGAVSLLCLTLNGCRNAALETCRERILLEDAFEDLISRIEIIGGPVVARVDGHPITALELKGLLKQIPPAYRQQFASPQGRRQLLEDVLQMDLVLLDARRAGIECDEHFQMELNQIRKGLIMKFYRERVLDSLPPQSDADLEAFFAFHSKDYVQQEIQASHIVLRSLADAKKAQRLLKTGKSFETVARTLSVDRGSAAKGGKMLPFRPGQTDPTIGKTVAALKVGEISPILKTPAGYEIVRKDSETLQTPSFASVKEQVRDRVQNEIVKDRFAQLKSSAKIEVDEKTLEAVDLPVTP